MQSVSGQKEDPLSTHPVFLLALSMGILVIILGIAGRVVWHERAYIPAGTSTISLLHYMEGKKESRKDIFVLQPFVKTASAQEVLPKEVVQEDAEKNLERDVFSLVQGYPMEAMASAIAKQDRKVAAFLVGIAKKESDWGKHVPTKDGKDCYNYWGYKGAGSLGQGMGYACFESPEEAITIVGGRLFTLVIEKENETPREMVIWKCGSRSCAGHAPGSAEKWISDVTVYYSKLVAVAG